MDDFGGGFDYGGGGFSYDGMCGMDVSGTGMGYGGMGAFSGGGFDGGFGMGGGYSGGKDYSRGITSNYSGGITNVSYEQENETVTDEPGFSLEYKYTDDILNNDIQDTNNLQTVETNFGGDEYLEKGDEIDEQFEAEEDVVGEHEEDTEQTDNDEDEDDEDNTEEEEDSEEEEGKEKSKKMKMSKTKAKKTKDKDGKQSKEKTKTKAGQNRKKPNANKQNNNLRNKTNQARKEFVRPAPRPTVAKTPVAHVVRQTPTHVVVNITKPVPQPVPKTTVKLADIHTANVEAAVQEKKRMPAGLKYCLIFLVTCLIFLVIPSAIGLAIVFSII